MYIHRRYRIWLACDDTKTCRPALRHVSIERTEDNAGLALAANGFILAVVPVQMEEGEEDCLIPLEAWRLAAHLPRNGTDRLRLRLGQTEELVTLPNGWRVPKGTGQFVAWRKMIPPRPEGKVSAYIGVNPPLLYQLYQALGIESGTRIQIGKSPRDVILIEEGNSAPSEEPRPPFGLLMPMHLGWSDAD